jgi:hypothetical protein
MTIKITLIAKVKYLIKVKEVYKAMWNRELHYLTRIKLRIDLKWINNEYNLYDYYNISNFLISFVLSIHY